MNFLKGSVPVLKSKRRCFSAQDHYFYKHIIHQAQNIHDIPSSLAQEIAEIVRNTSVLRSDWKKVARGLGLDNEGELKNIEDAARYKQELPLYVALTSLYMVNPAASLGALLESLIKLKRYDILIKIKDNIQEFIHEHNERKLTNSSFSSQNGPKKQPIEEDSTYGTSRCQESIKSTATSSHSEKCHCCNSCTYQEKESDHDSAFYEQRSAPNSLLEILNMNHEIIKDDKSVGWSVWKQQNKDNILENGITSFKKADSLETTDFQFIDPTNKTQGLSTNASEKEQISSPVAMHTSGCEWANTELMGLFNNGEDSESTYDEDFDPDLTGQETFNVNLCDKYTALSINSDTRRTQEDKHQNSSCSDCEGPESSQYEEQYSESESEAYDLNNTVNESIENLVAERNASIRSVEKAEREPYSAFLPLETCEPVKKPQDYLLSSMSSVMPPDSSITSESIKVIVVHSEDDGDIAIEIASALIKEFKMAAVAECQLNPVWHIEPSLFRRTALYWADVIIPLITNTWLEDIANEKPLQKREISSLNARAVFRILQNMFTNRGSMNLSCIPVVMEGTSRRFQHYPEIRDAIRLKRDIYENGSIKKLGDFVKGFHNLTKDAKRETKRLLLE